MLNFIDVKRCYSVHLFVKKLVAIMALHSYLQETGLVISQSVGDRHCLLYSVVKAFNNQLKDTLPVTLEKLKPVLISEVLSNPIIRTIIRKSEMQYH